MLETDVYSTDLPSTTPPSFDMISEAIEVISDGLADESTFEGSQDELKEKKDEKVQPRGLGDLKVW